jgi:hypothetical protein
MPKDIDDVVALSTLEPVGLRVEDLRKILWRYGVGTESKTQSALSVNKPQLLCLYDYVFKGVRIGA